MGSRPRRWALLIWIPVGGWLQFKLYTSRLDVRYVYTGVRVSVCVCLCVCLYVENKHRVSGFGQRVRPAEALRSQGTASWPVRGRSVFNTPSLLLFSSL